MHQIGRRRRNQPAPPRVVFGALTEFDPPGARPWLALLDDEQRPDVLRSRQPVSVVWSSIWITHRDATVGFDLQPDGGSGTDLCWTLFVDGPVPDDTVVGHMRKRLNELINRDLRYSFGQ